MADINELLPTVPVGLFEAGHDGRVTAANAAFAALVQASGGSPAGAAPWANAHPGDRASAELAWRRAADMAGDIQVSFRVWHAEGGMVWVRVDASPVRDQYGRIMGFAGVALDHTESVHRQQLLDRLAGVVAASDDAVLILDRNGAPVYTNQAART